MPRYREIDGSPPLHGAGVSCYVRAGLRRDGDVRDRRAAGLGELKARLFHREPGFSMTALWLIVACGALSIVYAVWAIRSVLAADAGNARMQEIAAAMREGAQAYLKRQYTTIGIVGDRDLPAGRLFPRLAGGGRLRDRRGAVGRWPASSA